MRKQKTFLAILLTLMLAVTFSVSNITTFDTYAASKKYTKTYSLKRNYYKTVKLKSKIKSVKSSNKKVATVKKSGKKFTIVTKKKGTAIITVKCKNKKTYRYKVKVSNKKHKHSYTSAVTTQPTCTSEGTRTYTCECGHSYTESIAKSDHCWHTTTETKTIHHDAEYTTERHVITSDGVDHGRCDQVDMDALDVYCTQHNCSYGAQTVQVLVREAWDETVTTEVTTCSNCGTSK